MWSVVRPIEVQVLAFTPSEYFHCVHCEVAWREIGVGRAIHREQSEASVPADLMAEFKRLSQFLRCLMADYGNQVVVRVVDAASLEGFLRSMRFRVRTYPTFIIDGKEKISGPDYARVREAVARRLTTVTHDSAPSR